MFCKFCGNEVPDGAKFCSACGKCLKDDENACGGQNAANQGAPNQSGTHGYANQYPPNGAPYPPPYYNPLDVPNAGWTVLGFFVPLVGLILYLVWQREYPNRAKSCGKGALASVIVYAALIFIYIVIIVIVAVAMASNPALAVLLTCA